MTKGHARKREIRAYMELNPGVRYTEAARIVAEMRANREIGPRINILQNDEGTQIEWDDTEDTEGNAS